MSCHTFRPSFATRTIEDGYDYRTIQELIGHSNVTTTRIDTHGLDRGGRGVWSPAEAPFASIVAARPRTRQLPPPSNSRPADLPLSRQLMPTERDTEISAEPYEDD
jgi:hypothetical protein